jgi:MerR family transcriptional regulator, thiopeptide resistance regulator
MPITDTSLKHVKEFAGEAGVTVRTLRLYDELGLLKPAAFTPSGYRLYGQAQLARLEHIVALRFVGFSLDQIKELLEDADPPLVVALRMQREVIARQKRRLESALAAIDEAQCALQRDGSIDLWGTLHTVIEVFKMQNDWEWTKKYYCDDALSKLEEKQRTTPAGAVERAQRDWADLIAEVEKAAACGVDPLSAQARALGQRWRYLVSQFTGNDSEIHQGLNKLWSDSAHWPADFKRPWNDAADTFIKAAMGCKM